MINKIISNPPNQLLPQKVRKNQMPYTDLPVYINFSTNFALKQGFNTKIHMVQ